jgi:hypothetical protein
MSADSRCSATAATPLASPAPSPASLVPQHWTPEQALAVFECLHAMRHALWATYGPQVQQAWRDQLVPEGLTPELDPDDPF